MTRPGAVRVFLVDDHEVVRRGLADLLTATEEFVVVGEASTLAEARRRIPASRPDVAVLDVRLPDGSGLTLCRELAGSGSGPYCLMLSSHDEPSAVIEAYQVGARGYLLKEARAALLIDSIRQVAAGQLLPHLPPDRPSSHRVAVEREAAAGLSERERAILSLLGDGLTNRQIAESLFISEKTVANNVSALLTKMNLQRRTQAAVIGARLRDATGRDGTAG